MISARLGGAGDLHLFAPVRGLASEVPLLLAALEAAPPSVVGLGISPDELRGLLDYFVNATAEPVVPLTTAERSEVRGLVRFGEVRVPNPAFVELLRWAREIPVEALDPTEDRTANLFADHIGYVELVRRTVRERRVSRTPPAPPSPSTSTRSRGTARSPEGGAPGILPPPATDIWSARRSSSRIVTHASR